MIHFLDRNFTLPFFMRSFADIHLNHVHIHASVPEESFLREARRLAGCFELLILCLIGRGDLDSGAS